VAALGPLVTCSGLHMSRARYQACKQESNVYRVRRGARSESSPISAITHYAPVDRIELYGDEGKYRLIFTEPAKALPQAIPFADAPLGSYRLCSR